MQHSSKAHLLPHDQHEVPPAPAHPSNASTPRTGFSQVSPHQSPIPHGRRLQLRNAHFTATPIPPRRISPILGLAASPIESFSRLQDGERSPPRAEKRILCEKSLPSSPVNILQEIQNSARRRKSSSEEGFGQIFQDSTSMDENTRPLDDDEMSWYEEKSNECTPSATGAASSILGLREGSLNQKSLPPMKSPVAKQTRGRARARSSLSADNVEQSRYIEHLESQLASVQAKIDGLTSPKASKLRSVKLRSLTTENRNLAKDNAEWAKRAEEMVLEEKKRYASLELEVKTLEEALAIKDGRIADFEWELEAMRMQVKEAEGLEEANANLEKKIDMLSGLLVNSPNKTGTRSVATSPKKLSTQASPVKWKPRPTSVLSRVPSSPNGTRMSLASASETAFWDSRSRSASILETREDSSLLDNGTQPSQSPISNIDNISPDSSKRFSFSDSCDDRRNSTSFTTRTGPSSRPTSFMSTSSMGVPTWGVPMQHDGDSKYSNRQRKMRKFPSGSNSLKPLILPVASNTNGQALPASAPIYPSIDTVAYREISQGSSIDPTTAFLTNFGDNSLYSTPTFLSRPRSTTLAREETLRALEGRRPECSIEGKEFDGATCVASSSSLEANSTFAESPYHRRPKPQNLQKELEEVNLEHSYLDASGTSATAVDGSLLSPGTQSSGYEDPTQLPESMVTPRGYLKTVETQFSNTPTTLKAQNTALFDPASHPSRSLFARITSLITQAKQDPFELARRILVNAWTLGCTSLGGLGWWLIGPLHHHQRCRLLEGTGQAGRQKASDRTSGRRIYDPHPWQHFSAEIRNGRLIDSSICGGSWTTPNPQEACSCHSEPLYLPTRRSQPHLFPCDACVEPSSRRSLRIWFQFSLTIVLAVGLAVKYGPSILLAELSEDGHTIRCPRRAGKDEQQDQEHRDDSPPRQDDEDDTVKLDAVVEARSIVPCSHIHTGEEARSTYGNIAFAEVLRPVDFEAG